MIASVHFPILQVVLPLLLAPVCLLLRGARLAWFTALTASWAAFGIAVALLLDVLAGGPVSYAVGGWNAPWGIELRVDAANAYVLTIVAGIGAVVMIFARQSVEHEIGNSRAYLFYTAYLLCLAGLLGVTITGDAFNLFVFLEISSLSSYLLISLGKDRRALYAAYQYLILGTIGATFYLIGVGLLYQVTGTLNIIDLSQRIGGQEGLRGVRVAFAFLTVGISLKLALFPLHLWLPNAYAYAPSAVTGFLAATATKVAVYVLLRVFFTIFGVDFSFEQMPLGEVLMTLAVAAMFVASTVAIFQNNVKRMLAYSSVAQIGYISLGIGMASVTGVQAGVLHLFNHAIIKGGLFLAMGCIAYSIGSTHIRDMAGLGKRMPAGFISKWYLVLAALEQGWWWVAALILLSSLLAVMYIWKVVERMYFQPAAEGVERSEAPLGLLVPTWILIGASIWFGIDTRLSAGGALEAAKALLGAG
jgi:multicomponent Na+:H+ antiporter subunit D